MLSTWQDTMHDKQPAYSVAALDWHHSLTAEPAYCAILTIIPETSVSIGAPKAGCWPSWVGPKELELKGKKAPGL